MVCALRCNLLDHDTCFKALYEIEGMDRFDVELIFTQNAFKIATWYFQQPRTANFVNTTIKMLEMSSPTWQIKTHRLIWADLMNSNGIDEGARWFLVHAIGDSKESAADIIAFLKKSGKDKWGMHAACWAVIRNTDDAVDILKVQR